MTYLLSSHTPRLALTLVALLSFCCAEVQEILEEPELPESFDGAASDDELTSELDLAAVWSTSHPDYDGEIRVLLRTTPIEGLSPNYNVAFYRRADERFARIGKGCGFGGYHPPTLGRHPTLDIPAVVAESEDLPEHAYFFIENGRCEIFQENAQDWVPMEKPR